MSEKTVILDFELPGLKLHFETTNPKDTWIRAKRVLDMYLAEFVEDPKKEKQQ